MKAEHNRYHRFCKTTRIIKGPVERKWRHIIFMTERPKQPHSERRAGVLDKIIEQDMRQIEAKRYHKRMHPSRKKCTCTKSKQNCKGDAMRRSMMIPAQVTNKQSWKKVQIGRVGGK